jgi:hypothetical protein
MPRLSLALTGAYVLAGELAALTGAYVLAGELAAASGDHSGSESSTPTNRPGGPNPAAEVAGHCGRDFRALLLGARHAGPSEGAGKRLAGWSR